MVTLQNNERVVIAIRMQADVPTVDLKLNESLKFIKETAFRLHKIIVS